MTRGTPLQIGKNINIEKRHNQSSNKKKTEKCKQK
jgi:hypothetical protein